MKCSVLVFVALFAYGSAWAKTDAVAVLDIQGTGIPDDLLPTLTEVLTVEIDALGLYKVIAGRDIQAMLGFEKQKDVLGCTDAACLAEVGGALGVERIVAGHIGKVGSTFVVNIKLINIRMADAEARVYETVRGEVDALIATIRKSVGKLFGTRRGEVAAATESPPAVAQESDVPTDVQVLPSATGEASREVPQGVRAAESGGIGWGPYLLWGAGAVALGVGVVAGIRAKAQEAHANDSAYIGAQREADVAPRTARLANFGYTLGVLCIGGGVLWAILGSGDGGGVAMMPTVSSTGLGLSVASSF